MSTSWHKYDLSCATRITLSPIDEMKLVEHLPHNQKSMQNIGPKIIVTDGTQCYVVCVRNSNLVRVFYLNFNKDTFINTFLMSHIDSHNDKYIHGT